jgi:hypothetical protein
MEVSFLMAVRKSDHSSKGTEKPSAKQEKVWSKPRITRHGNMRQITQMS